VAGREYEALVGGRTNRKRVEPTFIYIKVQKRTLKLPVRVPAAQYDTATLRQVNILQYNNDAHVHIHTQTIITRGGEM